MTEHHILVVEDEAAIREMLHLSLKKAGYVVSEAADVRQAKALIYNQAPTLILLDWMLPHVSGIEFARQLKKEPQTQQIPIIMLTAKGDESDKVRGLEVGADDYITKPFSPRELIARIKAVLRRSSSVQQENQQLSIKELQLDPAEHRVLIKGEEVQIGPTEFRLLHFFMKNPERVYSRSQVLDQVWGGNVYIEERTVDVHIRRLRKILAEYQYEHLVQTVRGVGYRFSIRE
ncbi:phosphate regulon transcriptional regulator PhoB [Thioflexithrix psekupsensis]|uniref:Phosphate regulon transcriptional regulatory protein PhoB n=1 Tax=Thioflexithrix psekupsensis TaxID=1570016 RepID=A0A251X399_9GAMM|nr:phosphate regulon transcriptional regulator PhoB [Thioflexithrix psekupsensis]OUD11642.1 phosphate regulon transcriptional regulatory protein PhoB [Thioflexithrix psekupsensis]